MSTGPRLHFAAALFGSDYVDRFLLGGLPSQLSPGNLPALDAVRGKPLYHLFSTPTDLVPIQASPLFARLEKLVEVALHDISPQVSAYKARQCSAYDIMNGAYLEVLHTAYKDAGALVAIWPDVLFSDGAFSRLQTLVDQGIRGVAVTGNQAAPTLVEAARQTYLDASGETLVLPPRQLLALSMQHMTPYWTQFFADSPCFPSEDATHAQWRVGSEGFLTRTSYLHPILAVPTAASCAYGLDSQWNGLDTTDFLATLSDDLDRDIHVVTDSDEFCFVGIDPRTTAFRNRPRPLNRVEMALALARTAHPLTRRFLSRSIHFRTADPSPAWVATEQQAQNLIQTVLQCLDLLQASPEAHKDLLNLQARGALTPDNELLFDQVTARVEALAAAWLHAGKRVAIHGAGAWTQRLLAETTLGRCKVVAVVDSNPILQGQRLLDWLVIAPEDLATLAPEAVLVTSFRSFTEITHQLKALPGFSAELHPLTSLEPVAYHSRAGTPQPSAAPRGGVNLCL